MAATPEPVLKAPGAGLSTGHTWLLKSAFTLQCKALSREKVEALHSRQKKLILELVEPLTSEQKASRILVPPLLGIEDSSRYWSVYMTLEHLTIVDTGLSQIIASLASGDLPEGEVKTADVKPHPEADEKAERAFISMTTRSARDIAKIPNIATPLTHEHPWFGPMNAAKWHTLKAVHLRIHRVQIEKIISQLV